MEAKKMTNFERRLIIEKVIGQFGLQAQLDMMTEECGELIVAINHYKRKRVSKEKVVEELADVWIMVMELAILLDEDGVGNMIDQKLRRVERVVDELKKD